MDYRNHLGKTVAVSTPGAGRYIGHLHEKAGIGFVVEVTGILTPAMPACPQSVLPRGYRAGEHIRLERELIAESGEPGFKSYRAAILAAASRVAHASALLHGDIPAHAAETCLATYTKLLSAEDNRERTGAWC